MLKKLDKKLKAIYDKYKDQKNPPVPIKKNQKVPRTRRRPTR